VRRDPALAALAGKVHVSAPPEIDRLYPQLRPARVTSRPRAEDSPARPTRRSARWCHWTMPASRRNSTTSSPGARRRGAVDGQAIVDRDALDDVAPLVEALAKPA
jgi:hypothetical protein